MAKRSNGEGSIFRTKSGKWLAVYTVGRNDKGKLIRRQKTADTKRAALAELDKLKATYRSGLDSLSKETPLLVWLDLWLKTYKEGRIREHTLYTYKRIILRISNDAIGKTPISELKGMSIQAFINTLKPSIGRYTLSLLRSALNQAVNEGILAFNPARAAIIPRHVKKPVSIITEKELVKLLDGATNPLRIAILIGWGTGARPEEILGLTWNAIDFDKGRMSIYQATNYTGKGLAIVPPKTKTSMREIDLPPALLRDLKLYKREQAVFIMAHRQTYEDKGFIVAKRNGKPYHSGEYGILFSKQAKKAGVNITPKGLRHSHATQLFNMGIPPKIIQHRLGHSKIGITLDIYTHILESSTDKLTSCLNDLYSRCFIVAD